MDEFSQLPEDELETYLEEKAKQEAAEKEAEQKRRAKIRDFHFKGGML